MCSTILAKPWQLSTKLVASDGAPFDAFGRAVAISGDAILVGANARHDVGLHSGAAYVFRHDGVTWQQEAKLLPTTPSDVYFGWTVALSGDVAVVGAPYGEGGFLSSGAVYIFRHDGASWIQETRLISGAVGGAGLRDLFGWSVALNAETLVIGAPTADLAYVLALRDSRWTLIARLTGGQPDTIDQFGYAVAIDGALLAVGAPHANALGHNAGLAYLFASDGTHWRQTAELISASVTPGGLFGSSVAVHGNRVVVGAPHSEGVEDAEASGVADVWRFDGTDWARVAHVAASDAAAGSAYVWTVASSANPLVARVDAVHYATSGRLFANRHLHIRLGLSDGQGQPMAPASVTVRVDCNTVPYWTGSGATNAEGTVELLLNNYPIGCYRTTVIDLNGNMPATPENEHCKGSFLRRR